MNTLEALQPNASVRGILPDCLVTVVSVQWFGSQALELTYKDPAGKVANQLLYRHDEPRLSGEDRKWRELAHLLSEIFTPAAIANVVAEDAPSYGADPANALRPSPHQKLVIFTEHRELRPDEPGVEDILTHPECTWISRDLEQQAQTYAISTAVPEHFEEVRVPRLARIAKTEAAVKDRLTKEISYWDHRAEVLKLQEQAGKPNARLNSNAARKRADSLETRLQKRMEELKLEANLSPLPPVILGGLLVVPVGLLAKLSPATLIDGFSAALPTALSTRCAPTPAALSSRAQDSPAQR